MIADQVGCRRGCSWPVCIGRTTLPNRLTRLANGTLRGPRRCGQSLAVVEKHIGLALAESQVAADRLALMSKVTVMKAVPASAKPPSSKPSCISSPQRD